MNLINLGLIIFLISCAKMPSSFWNDSLSQDELKLLEQRGKENSTSILNIDSPSQKNLLEMPSRTIKPNTAGIGLLVAELEKTVRKHGGMGIASVQIGVPVRIILILRAEEGGPKKFYPLLNPRIIHASAKQTASWEQCLSVSWGYRFTYRYAEVTVEFQTIEGKATEKTFQGEESVVLQQEIDHLDGILLNTGQPKEYFIPNYEMNAFARNIWHQCQSLNKHECDSLMELRWQERGKALRRTPSNE